MARHRWNPRGAVGYKERREDKFHIDLVAANAVAEPAASLASPKLVDRI